MNADERRWGWGADSQALAELKMARRANGDLAGGVSPRTASLYNWSPEGAMELFAQSGFPSPLRGSFSGGRDSGGSPFGQRPRQTSGGPSGLTSRRLRRRTILVGAVLLAAGLCSAQPPGVHAAEPLRTLSPAQCMPTGKDYTFLWWAHGWRGRDDKGRRILCIQTGHYGLALDVEKMRLLHLGTIDNPKPYPQAARQSNDVIFSLPEGVLDLIVEGGEKRYTCVAGATDQKDRANFPIRIIESGRFRQRVDIHGLVFEDKKGNRLSATGRLEITAWPDRVAFLLDVTPHIDLDKASPCIRVDDARGGPWIETRRILVGTWRSNETKGVSQSMAVQDGRLKPGSTELATTSVVVTESRTDGGLRKASLDSSGGHYHVKLRKQRLRQGDLDYMERVKVRVENPEDEAMPVRLLFDKEACPTGMSAMLRDAEGNPTGIPVQISKNWHQYNEKGKRRVFLYEGPWFHGASMLRMPPRSAVDLELTLVTGRWGGVPAASHAQLCLIGWGTNQLWDEAAIGNWGESICYEPDGAQRDCMIDDLRPLMVWGKEARQKKWDWTNNVGGGDFLVYYDAKLQRQFLSRMRTAYHAQCPNLTRVTYAGTTADGNIDAAITVSTPRCDDINRAFHRFRYDVRKPTPFTRMAFYQVGADRYNPHQFDTLARGNEKGLIEQWRPPRGEKPNRRNWHMPGRYGRTGIACPGRIPWFSLHDAISKDTAGGAWANRGLVIRTWKARLGGKDVPAPTAAVFQTFNGPPSNALELTAPPGIEKLLPGDFVECELELLVIPMKASDYYGPNENLRKSLQTTANTWKPVFRQAVGNDLKISAGRGEVLHTYPIVVAVDAKQSAEVTVTGGLGYVPITFTGLKDYRGYRLTRREAGAKGDSRGQALVLRSPQGEGGCPPYWQMEHDPGTNTWGRTYNVSLDTPGDERRAVTFVLEKQPKGLQE